MGRGRASGYRVQPEPLEGGPVRLRIEGPTGRPLPWGEAITAWQREPGLREALSEALRQAPWEALFFEAPPISADRRDRPFEPVLLEARALANAAPEPEAFAEHFTSDPGDGIVAFDNLGGDARLVVPCPRGPDRAYPHLARFVRRAPDAQVHALWRRVGRALEQRLESGPGPVWVSTSGLGVGWVHLRLDARPKYYTYAPYRRPDG